MFFLRLNWGGIFYLCRKCLGDKPIEVPIFICAWVNFCPNLGCRSFVILGLPYHCISHCFCTLLCTNFLLLCTNFLSICTLCGANAFLPCSSLHTNYPELICCHYALIKCCFALFFVTLHIALHKISVALMLVDSLSASSLSVAMLSVSSISVAYL